MSMATGDVDLICSVWCLSMCVRLWVYAWWVRQDGAERVATAPPDGVQQLL